MGTGVVERSTSVWRVCLFLSIVGVIFFFLGFSLPHLIDGEFSDGNNATCGKIRAGLWEQCTSVCSYDDWHCHDWEHEKDFLTVSRVFNICAGSFAVLGFLLTLISIMKFKKSYIMLLAAVLNLLAASTGASGIGIFLVQEKDDFDDQFGGMESNSSNLGWGGSLVISAIAIFFVNTVCCLVDWRYNMRLDAYQEI